MEDKKEPRACRMEALVRLRVFGALSCHGLSLQKDLETLEVAEGGSWEELSKAHRDLVGGPASPSGLPNRYGMIPYAFPAAVAVTGLSALSDALVGHRRWSDPMVMEKKHLLLYCGPITRETYVTTWRRRAFREAMAAFLCARQIEKEAFGHKSFFVAKADGRLNEGDNQQDDDGAEDAGEGHVHGQEPEDAGVLDPAAGQR